MFGDAIFGFNDQLVIREGTQRSNNPQARDIGIGDELATQLTPANAIGSQDKGVARHELYEVSEDVADGEEDKGHHYG